MDARDADLLKEIDPAELGQRVRAARVAKGWTQTELAGEEISVGYVSRIESGQRRPNGQTLDVLATRLGVPVERLLRGVTAREYDEIKLTLDFAELSLETGQHLEAEVQARGAVERADSASQDELAFRGRFIIARALEGQGSIDDAIIELEPLAYSRQGGVLRIKCAIALCRCYRASGDLAHAIEVGERVLAQLANSPLDATDESVQMAVTLALAYGDRGDIGQAVRICRRAISKAETLDSAMARAAAYWNASIFESERGSVSNAVAMAERALTLLSEGQDARNLARLRSQIGNLQLELDPPAVADARQHLEKAAEELPWSGASPVEIAQNRLLQARAHLLGGDLDVADSMCQEAMEVATSDTPGFAASARAVLGQIHAARGDTEGAKTLFRQAVYFLTGAGADRDAAQLWFELADLLEGVGDLDAAREAYRSAAASTGLRSRPKTQGSTTDVRSTSHAGAF